jgi:hypothetical protein
MSILSKSDSYNEKSNQRLFKILSIYLNIAPDYVEKKMIDEITCGNSEGEEFAFANLAAAACGLNIYEDPLDKQFFRTHFLPCFKKLSVRSFLEDPYYNQIIFPHGVNGDWAFETRICKPYEAFVYDDPEILPDGRILPRIGFFDTEYAYPAVLENGREWMTLMPNETNTTKPAIDIAYGKVLTFGLGLGYFTFMASIKHDVESVTVVERSDDVIELFERFILPQFPDPSKIKIVRSDAFDFAENQMAKGAYDSVFVDIWHDPSDGCDLYLKMKEYETLLPKAKFVYWVEDTLKLYI